MRLTRRCKRCGAPFVLPAPTSRAKLCPICRNVLRRKLWGERSYREAARVAGRGIDVAEALAGRKWRRR